MRSLRGLPYLPLPEDQPIGFHGRPFTRAASNIIEASLADMLAGLSFEEIGVRGDGGNFGIKESCSVDVLNSREAQKLRWRSAFALSDQGKNV